MRVYRRAQADIQNDAAGLIPRDSLDVLTQDMASESLLGVLPLRVEVQHYGPRAFAVYVNGELLAVTMYLKGARAIERLINDLCSIAAGERMGRMRPEHQRQATAFANY